mgnify:CR=1 FL=1
MRSLNFQLMLNTWSLFGIFGFLVHKMLGKGSDFIDLDFIPRYMIEKEICSASLGWCAIGSLEAIHSFLRDTPIERGTAGSRQCPTLKFSLIEIIFLKRGYLNWPHFFDFWHHFKRKVLRRFSILFMHSCLNSVMREVLSGLCKFRWEIPK